MNSAPALLQMYCPGPVTTTTPFWSPAWSMHVTVPANFIRAAPANFWVCPSPQRMVTFSEAATLIFAS